MSRFSCEGRAAEFEREVLPHLDAVFTVALRLCGSRIDAEDLTQETFLRAFAAFDRFARGTSARAWVFTILRNGARNRQRDRERQALSGALDSDLLAAAPKDEPPDWAPVTAEDLDAAIRLLPLPLREAVVLRDVAGLSYKEVAASLACPVGTVMSRLHRGRARLRRLVVARLAQVSLQRAL